MCECILKYRTVVTETGTGKDKPLILTPETLLVKVRKIAAGKICHVVKPLGNLTTLTDVADVPRPEKRTNPAHPSWWPSKRTNVEHRPVEQVTVCVFSMLIHDISERHDA
jgi:hypothetical protein